MRNTFRFLLISLAAVAAWAQQTAIQGTVHDASGAVIPNAMVKLQPAGGGPAASSVASSEGAFVFPNIAANEYKVRAEAAGFTPAERTVTILVGQSATLDFTLKPASATTVVEVQAEAAGVDVNSSQVGGNIDPGRMKETPLNGRNWMELALLVPGITQNAVSTTPLGSVSQGKFQINVDGQQVTQNAAGAGFGQPQYSREAMAQFQVITNRFDATLGRSSQIQVNAQTKSGTNSLHGSAYGYFRSDSLNAADPIAQRVLPFSNQQYGGTVGGRIIPDKLFFFGAYEGERQPSTVVLTPVGFSGQKFEFQNDFKTQTWLTRVDWQVKASTKLSFRANGAIWRNPFGNVSGTSHPSQAAKQTRDGRGMFVDWSWMAKNNLVNDVKYGYNYFQWTNNPYVETLEMRFPSITIGGPYNYPQIFNQNTHQVRDDLYWFRGKHNVKAGGEYLSNNHTGLFQQNIRGLASPITSLPANISSLFPVWNDPATWNLAAVSPLVSTYTQGFGDFNIDIPRNVIGAWIQDDWKLHPRFTLNLGLRYDVDKGVWATPALKSGVVPQRGGENHNFAPRIGFAWDLTGDRKTVIRGGGGLYYADIQANQVIDQQIFNGEQSIQAGVSKTATTSIDLLHPFGSATGADFLSGKVAVPLQNIQVLAPGAQTPFSVQGSFGAERQLGAWTISGDFVYWRVYHEWQRQDRNIFFDPATGFPVNPAVGGRPNPKFGQILQFATPDAAGAIYTGGQFEITRRFGQRYQVGTSYTLSHLRDSSTGAFNYPNNQFDLADEWADSLDDQRHTLNFDGSMKLPFGLQTSMFYHFGSGAAFNNVSPQNVFGYAGTSNRTFKNGTAVFVDPKYIVASRAAGYSNVLRNVERGTNIHRLDFRLTKSVTVHEKWRMSGIFEVFNVLNYQNYGTFQTNIGSSLFGRPAYNSNLAYAARMLQFAVRFDF